MSGVTKMEKKAVVKGQRIVNMEKNDEIFFRNLLVAHIGPDADELIEEGETARDAYHRNQSMIMSFCPLLTADEIIERADNYEEYYAKNIIKKEDVVRIFSNMEEIGKFMVILQESDRPQDVMDAIVMVMLELEEKDFSQFFNSIKNFSYFLRVFPQHAGHAMERVFASSLCLNAIFSTDAISSSVEKAERFKREFPEHKKDAAKWAGEALKKSESKGFEKPLSPTASHTLSSSPSVTFKYQQGPSEQNPVVNTKKSSGDSVPADSSLSSSGSEESAFRSLSGS